MELVQLVGDPGGTGTVQAHTVDVLDHAGSIGVWHKLVLVFRGLHIAVHGKGSHKVTVAPLYIQGASGLDGNIPAVGFIHSVLDRHCKIIPTFFVGGVYIVIDGNKPNTVSREHPAQLAACLDVLTAQAGQVFHDNAVDFSVCDLLHHFLERGAVKENTAVTIIDFF